MATAENIKKIEKIEKSIKSIKFFTEDDYDISDSCDQLVINTRLIFDLNNAYAYEIDITVNNLGQYDRNIRGREILPTLFNDRNPDNISKRFAPKNGLDFIKQSK